LLRFCCCWEGRETYKDNSVQGQVTGIGELFADGAESEELVLNGGGLDGILNVLDGLACKKEMNQWGKGGE